MKILIDNGHGVETPGKRSPDGRLREYAWARACARLIVEGLKARGYDAELLVAEEEDVSLRLRCQRANVRCELYGASKVLVVSIHNNAAGNNAEWLKARGFSAHVSKNASARSKKLAKCLWDVAIERGLRGNRSVPAEGYIVQNLAICRDTKCAAVLTENLFMDNREDCEYLLTDEGKQVIAQAHIDGIINYIKEVG